jgi:uncharacterized membrane protein
MQVIRELELDNPADEVWRLLSDREELAAWVGDEVRSAPVSGDGDSHRLTWTWSPDGVESTVEITVTGDGDRSVVRVVETAGVAISSARACAVQRWDDALLTLELRALTWTHRLVTA